MVIALRWLDLELAYNNTAEWEGNGISKKAGATEAEKVEEPICITPT